MTSWAAPAGTLQAGTPGLLDALRACFTPASYDAVTMATPLDVLKQNQALLVEDVWVQNPQFGRWAGIGWEWANLGCLAGGAWLMYKRVFSWHAPPAWPVPPFPIPGWGWCMPWDVPWEVSAVCPMESP